MDARKLASFDIQTRANNRQYQCNNPIVLNQKIIESSCNDEIDVCISDFTNMISDISSQIFKPSQSENKEQENFSKKTDTPWFNDNKENKEQENFSKKTDTPWFNDKCEEKRHYFLHYLDRYRASKTDENRRNLVRARSDYKSFIRKCR